MKANQKNRGGYTDEHLRLAREYAENWKDHGKIPQIARLARHCGISTSALYDWIKKPECAELAEVYARVKTEQECELVDGGLSRTFDSGLSKLMLIKHGYSDKQEIDLTAKVSVNMVGMEEL